MVGDMNTTAQPQQTAANHPPLPSAPARPAGAPHPPNPSAPHGGHYPQRPTPPTREASKVSPAAEALGYAGGVLTAIAALYLLGNVWGDLQAAGQSLLLALATAALGGVAAIVGNDDGIARRLSATLWLLAGGTGTFTAYLVVDQVAGLGAEAGLLAAGSSAAVAAGTAWWRTGRAVLGGVAYVGGLAAVLGGVGIAGGDEAVTSVVLWIIGAAWAAIAAAGLLRPAGSDAARHVRVPLSLGALTAIGAAQAVLTDSAAAGLLLGLLTVVVLAACAHRVRDGLALGWVGLAAVVFLPQAAFRWVPEEIAGAAALLAVGVGMLVACAWLVRRSKVTG